MYQTRFCLKITNTTEESEPIDRHQDGINYNYTRYLMYANVEGTLRHPLS